MVCAIKWVWGHKFREVGFMVDDFDVDACNFHTPSHFSCAG